MNFLKLSISISKETILGNQLYYMINQDKQALKQLEKLKQPESKDKHLKECQEALKIFLKEMKNATKTYNKKYALDLILKI